MKEAVRQDLIERGAAGGTVYEVGIFPRHYRRGDVSLAAERVNLVTLPSPYELGDTPR